MTTVLLLGICVLSQQVVLVVLLGLFGLGGNPGLISMAVRFAGRAPALGSALTVAVTRNRRPAVSAT